MSQIIKVLPVEDDSRWQSIIGQILNKEENKKDIVLYGFVSSKEYAIQSIKLFKPDVIIMDLNLNGDNYAGIEIIKDIHSIVKSKIIVLTIFEDENLIEKAILAGASDYIVKGNDLNYLPEKIRQLHRNQFPLSVVLEKYRNKHKKERYDSLTKSEKEILVEAVNGIERNKLYLKLNKSENTIKSQINSLLKKLNVNSLKEAIKNYDYFLK